MKEIYQTPEMELIEFDSNDIIATSTNIVPSTNNDDEGSWQENW